MAAGAGAQADLTRRFVWQAILPAQLVGQDGILRPDAIRPLRVFILGGAKRHADSQDWLPDNALRASCQLSALSFQLSARGRSPFRQAWGLSGRIVAARMYAQV
jgi:hypothetical protein